MRAVNRSSAGETLRAELQQDATNDTTGANARMSAQINYTQDDRDRIVRMETNQEHLANTVDDIDRQLKSQVEIGRQNAETARDLNASVKGLLEWSKDHKDTPRIQAEHGLRIAALEKDLAAVKADTSELKDALSKAMFLGKIGYTILTTPVLIYIGFQLFAALQAAPK